MWRPPTPTSGSWPNNSGNRKKDPRMDQDQTPQKQGNQPENGDGPSKSQEGTPVPQKPKQKSKPPMRKGDLVFSPWTYGANIILQVVKPGPKLTFVIGDFFHEPTPVLTSELQPLQDAIGADSSKTMSAARLYALRSLRHTANDQGILRLQMLQEGLDRLQPAVEAAGVATGILTYLALKGILEQVLKDRTSAREQRPDYPYESEMFFQYD